MQGLIKTQKEIKQVLSEAEKNDQEFPWLFDKLSMIEFYGFKLSPISILGIIEEFIEDVGERRRVQALEGFKNVESLYSTISTKWNQRNNN
jgi:hypothetical protein